MTAAIAVLTHESMEDIFDRGGTGHWGTKADRAGKYEFVVCVRNRNHPRSPEDVPHRAAFLVGRISGIIETNHMTEAGIPRVLIKFSEYAIVERKHDAWGKSQNPVWYTSLEALGVDTTKLKFKPMPPPQDRESQLGSHNDMGESIAPSSTADILAEAKKSLAQRLRLPVSNVEITIKA
jgi:hypothetical protein